MEDSISGPPEDPLLETPDDPLLEELGERKFLVRLPDQDYRNALNPGRISEVAMVVERTPGWVLLQSKQHYPPGTFRLPTGTQGPDETPEQAVHRELHEEANLKSSSCRHLFTLQYEVAGGRQDFITNAFLFRDLEGELHPNDPSEHISAWREARISELRDIAGELKGMDPPWNGWGLFRSVQHRAVARVLLVEQV